MVASADRRWLRCTLLSAAALTAGIPVPGALAQAAPAIQAHNEKPLAFEVVSIRPDLSSAPGHEQITVTPDGWRMTHGLLMTPLLTAYVPTTSDAMMYTVSTLTGVPDWVRTEIYNIDAKVAEPDLSAWQNPATQPAMLRTMISNLEARK